MRNMNLENIAEASGGTLACEKSLGQKEVAGVVLDSRQVEQGYLFIATKGERVDGHQFIEQVFVKGALCVVCERVPEKPVPAYILVKDSFQALQQIAAFYRSQLNIPVVGITGSVGKTSTKEFIAGVLQQKYHVLKTEGNYNNEVGVPLTILKIRAEHEAAVLEMGINHFGEMSRLTAMVKPDICVMTNIGQCHLEFLGSREGILKAKSEIFEGLQKQGNVCVNGDDDMLQTIQQVKGKVPLRFGITADNDIYATDICDKGLFGSTCKIHVKQISFLAEVPLPGRHMIYNALAATAVGTLLDVTKEQIAAGIASVQALGGRNHIVQTEKYTIIDDCYNANPVSMRAGIDLLTMANGRKVALLGDMGELGERTEQQHTEIGKYVVEKQIDVLLCIGKLSAHMKTGAMQEAEKLGKQIIVQHFEEKELLMQQLDTLLRNNDTILIKASHSMGFESIVKALQEM